MAAEINILSSEILEHPEMCYDFEKGVITPHFDKMLSALHVHNAMPGITPKIYVRRDALTGEYTTRFPSWMWWLLINSKYKRVFKIPSGSEWHWASVFLHKCIDESAKRSMDRIISKRIVDLISDLKQKVREGDIKEVWGFKVAFNDKDEMIVDSNAQMHRLFYNAVTNEPTTVMYKSKIILGIHFAWWPGKLVIRLNDKCAWKIIDTKRAELLFSERMSVSGQKVPGIWRVGRYIIRRIPNLK